jgi:hypothetical protein
MNMGDVISAIPIFGKKDKFYGVRMKVIITAIHNKTVVFVTENGSFVSNKKEIIIE